MSSLREEIKQDTSKLHQWFKVIFIVSIILNICLISHNNSNSKCYEMLKDHYKETVGKLKQELHEYQMGVKQ